MGLQYVQQKVSRPTRNIQELSADISRPNFGCLNINSPGAECSHGFDDKSSCGVGQACFSESQNFPPRTRQVIKLAAGKLALHALSCLKQILKHDLEPARCPIFNSCPYSSAPPHPVALSLSKRRAL